MSPDLHTLTGAYALNALDPAERADFERHLAACPDCAAEVVELRATAVRLGAAVAVSPPERLRVRVRQGIARTRQDPPDVLRLVQPRQRDVPVAGRKWLLPATAVAAGVALLAAGTFAGMAVHAGAQERTARAQLDAAQYRDAPISQLLAAPDVRVVSGGGDGGTATLLDSHALHKGLLVVQHLPSQPAGKTYQAWDISLTGFQSLGLLGNGSSGSVTVPELSDSDDIGITVEPIGGSDQPTSVPIMDFAVLK